MLKNLKMVLMGSALLIFCLALIGCAGQGGPLQSGPFQTGQSTQTRTTEQLLSAAGFQQIYPATPALKARLASMPQKQLFLTSRGSKVFYVYADAAGCGCLYAGNQAQYQAFQNLAARYNMAAMQYQAAQMNMESNWDWGEWGEAGPWY